MMTEPRPGRTMVGRRSIRSSSRPRTGSISGRHAVSTPPAEFEAAYHQPLRATTGGRLESNHLRTTKPRAVH